MNDRKKHHHLLRARPSVWNRSEGGATRPLCFRSRERLSKTETKIIPPRRRCYFSSRKPWKPARPARKGLEGHQRRRSESGAGSGRRSDRPLLSLEVESLTCPRTVNCQLIVGPTITEDRFCQQIDQGFVIAATYLGKFGPVLLPRSGPVATLTIPAARLLND